MNLGSLTIEMAADLARLRQDMADAKSSVGNAMADIEKAVGVAKTAFVALAGIGSVAAFVGMIKSSIDATAALHDLSIQTGASVAALAAFKSVGSYTETSADAIAGAMNKLAKNMAMADEDSKGAAIAIKALGINFDDFKKLKPEDQMLVAAKAMNQFEDGADKTAAAMLLFGKEGAKLLPFLKDLGDEADAISAKLTDQEKALKANQAAMADAFGDNLTKIRKESEGWKKDLSMGLLPAMYEASEAFLQMNGGAGGLKAKISELAKDGTLANWARGAMTALSYLVDVGQALFSLIPMLGKVIAGVAAGSVELFSNMGDAVQKVLKGDFSGALDSMKSGFNAVKTIGTATAQDVSSIWNQKLIGETFRETMASLNGVGVATGDSKKKFADLAGILHDTQAAQEAANKAIKEGEAALKAQKQAIAAATKAGDDFIAALEMKQATLQMELALGRKLTDAEKQQLELEAKVKDGKIILTDVQRKYGESLIAGNLATEEESKAAEEARKAKQREREENEKRIISLDAATKKQLEENYTLQFGKEALAELEIQRLRDEAAILRETVAQEQLLGMCTVETEAHKETLKALEALIAARESGAHLKAAKEAADEWQKTADTIGKSLTDSLFRAFEQGKSFGEALRDGLKNMFKTMVLQLVIQPVQKGVSGWIGGMFGGGSGAGSGMGGFGNMLSSGASYLGNGLSAFGEWMGPDSTIGGWASSAGNWLSNGSAGSFGQLGAGWSSGTSAMAAGNAVGGWNTASTLWGSGNYSGAIGQVGGMAASALGGFMAGRGVGQAISNGYSAIGGQSGNSAVNTGAAIGAAVGSIIPGLGTMIGGLIGGAIGGLVNRAFGHKAKEYNGDKGLEGTIGGAAGLTGNAWAEWTQKGGWFSSDKHGTDTFAMDQTTSDALKQGAKAVYDETSAWAKALGLPAERLANVVTTFRVKLTDSEEGNQKALAEAFGKYANDLTNSFADVIAPFQKAGESIQDTMRRLTVIQQFSESINQFGGIFSRVATLSISAREELIGFAGGLDAFIAKTKSFVDAYYTDAEKYGLQAKELQAALQSIGVDAGALTSRADFRKLVEGTDISTTEGRKQLDQLLTLAQAFAPVGQYLEQQGGSLAQLASQAPQTALVESILKDQETQAAYAEKQQAALDGLNLTMQGVHDMLERGFDRLSGVFADRLEALEGAIALNGRTISDAILEAQP